MGVCLDACTSCSHPMTYMYHDHDYLFKQTDGVIDTIELFLRYTTCFALNKQVKSASTLPTHQSGQICYTKVRCDS